jgi:glycerophosphoryl diester phosphodiesterase
MQQTIIAHRGARGLWPENSLDGFRRVLALGVTAVEFDVHPTACGDLAVIHDPTLERTSNGSGPVAERTLAELAVLRLKGTAEGVPALDDVLDILGPAGIELHVELKTDADNQPYPGLEEAVIARLEERDLMAHSVLTAFSPEVLLRLRTLRPQARLLAGLNAASATRLGGLDAALDTLAPLDLATLAVEKDLLRRELPRFLDRLGAAHLGVWTVNDPDEITFWRRAPVATLTSDRPDLCLATPRPEGKERSSFF